ncbi:MAG: 50S ribosomal protein L29 [Patescibacteria group bacterium]|nr:50S ribosomal protein L29 [Patescibacteria group bacterium]
MIKDYRGKSETELEKLLKAKREMLRDFRFKDSNRQLKNIRDIRVTKKEIAQIMTVLKEMSKKDTK